MNDSSTIRVLVVDDDEDDSFLICDSIAECHNSNYSVRASHRPDQAAELLRQGEADVVLCDYRMGAITGIEFIQNTRAEGIDVPIILLTGMMETSTDQEALEAGASDFLNKSNATPELLDRAIRYSIANSERNRHLHMLLNNVNAAVVLFDKDFQPTLWNPNFTKLAESYAKENDREFDITDFAKEMLEAKRIVTIDGRVLETRHSDTPSDGIVIILHDITEYVEALRELEIAENRAAHLAMNCSLTGLPNRNAFSERINQQISLCQTQGEEFFLLNLDLNKFKEVNDIYGHSYGDKLLVEVAQRLQSCCREGDYIARLGGDEFMAIQPKSSDEMVPTLAERIAIVLSEEFNIEGLLIRTGVSIGVSTYPQHGSKAEELMARSDIAMYKSKEDPSNPIYIYDQDMDAHVQKTMWIGQELRKAVEQGTIDLLLQPQADLSSGEITGFEALARWTHPDLGPVSPATFIPIAEEYGLIMELGELVLNKACEIAAAWPVPLKIAVNISPIQLRHANLPAVVHSVLLRTGLQPSRLELEVTESVLIEDANHAMHTLRCLKNLGVSIALDDFGTGYSSLSTLISFPFTKLKIDRSFIEDIGRVHQADVIVRSVISIGNQLGYRIIAEGVENRNQVNFLLKENCQEMQGFLIGRPMSQEKVAHLMPPGAQRVSLDGFDYDLQQTG